MFLLDPPPETSSVLPEGESIGPPPSIPSGRLPSDNLDEPLVEIAGTVDVLDAYGELGILPRRTLRVRRSVLDRLKSAEDGLPQGFNLVVLDGWRTLDEQRALLSHYGEAGPTDGYVADVDPASMRPPHTTGGAVDLTLFSNGSALALGTDFDSFSSLAHFDAFEASDGTVRRLRRALVTAMTSAGFVPYPFEWWHWSFGDDMWGHANGCSSLFEIL